LSEVLFKNIQKIHWYIKDEKYIQEDRRKICPHVQIDKIDVKIFKISILRGVIPGQNQRIYALFGVPRACGGDPPEGGPLIWAR
jgi:hypothetical protein